MNSFREYKRLSSFVADNRGYVRVSGTDIKKFLQGICTIEVNRCEVRIDMFFMISITSSI